MLGAGVRGGNSHALGHVVAALIANDGNVSATARALGVGLRTLYDWRDASPYLSRAFKDHAQTRAEAGRNSPGRPSGSKSSKKKLATGRIVR